MFNYLNGILLSTIFFFETSVKKKNTKLRLVLNLPKSRTFVAEVNYLKQNHNF